MFRKPPQVIHKHTTEAVPYAKEVTINEHRAPTDDSIKILREMEAKAEQRAIKKIRIDNNELSGALLVSHSFDDFTHWLKYRFKINGKEFEGKFEVDPDVTPGEAIELVYKGLGSSIAEELMVKEYGQIAQLWR